ncbi:hypothetical protein OV208_20310 [Corallococcus sp. bb12-1]|uniref:hypothetical protein n=1 Tax=Corallococcus sp. bb12-1 TaxID=2996784 RepID=UPI002270556F|nr:hypothetical protein [Corallococcus sp. bb12-1]MCY1043674.1 hypothetical protein [Corallococcus sp. bb12-1]
MDSPLDDFEFDALFPVMERLSKASSPEEERVLRIAAYGLHYLHKLSMLDGFRMYLRDADAPATDENLIEQEFVSMPDARKWLSQAPGQNVGTLVRIAGRTHAVWREASGELTLVPSLTPQDLEKHQK